MVSGWIQNLRHPAASLCVMDCFFCLDDVDIIQKSSKTYFIHFVNPISGDRHLFTSNFLVFTRDTGFLTIIVQYFMKHRCDALRKARNMRSSHVVAKKVNCGFYWGNSHWVVQHWSQHWSQQEQLYNVRHQLQCGAPQWCERWFRFAPVTSSL